jgi:hypothetical protein
MPESHRAGWNVAGYTKRHMANLSETGKTAEPYRQGDERDKSRARSRITNATRRLNIQVETHTEHGRIVGTVREE